MGQVVCCTQGKQTSQDAKQMNVSKYIRPFCLEKKSFVTQSKISTKAHFVTFVGRGFAAFAITSQPTFWVKFVSMTNRLIF